MPERTSIMWDSVAFHLHTIKHNLLNFPITMIIVMAIKAVGFSDVRQTLSNIFAMHYGDIKD